MTRVGIDRNLMMLVAGQLGLHSAMAGVRMAAPLQVLKQGHSPAMAGLLVALFAIAPVLLALPAGRMADRWGYRRPMRLATACTVIGAGLALMSASLAGTAMLLCLCASAFMLGAGANVGIIVSQRTAGRSAAGSAQRIRVFNWMGMAPSSANVVGPVSLGLAIDLAGFQTAYLLALVLPLLSWAAIHRVADAPPALAGVAARSLHATWSLLAAPGIRRLFAVNWLISSCWDAYTFAVPVLGHERGYNASTIGLLLGVFTLSVTAVRLVIPMLAHRLRELQILGAAMIATALVFAAYPLAQSPWLLGLLAVVLGLALGAVQPMIMSALHQLTPDHRHGEAIALRSVLINVVSSVMPLAMGLAGAAVGVTGLFWSVGAAVGAGRWLVPGLAPALKQAGQATSNRH